MISLNIHRFRSVFLLIVTMAMVGIVTLLATINTAEVVFGKDTEYSNVIVPVTISNSTSYNNKLIDAYSTNHQVGYFGEPKKIKFPESNIHYDITDAIFEAENWKATKGLAHTFMVDDSVQKMFGGAVIYMRYNTPTTKNIGSILSGDIINIVTTEGWQLGYQVDHTADDPSELPDSPPSKSRIIVILIDETTDEIKSVNASLSKVGERI